ncbi:hypothetical protein [Nocardia sp. NPDC049707]|uniref:hypothetical protein n=1 Tax=Nocardia sp. NPDC049707 TaxID=3154735 RepID=UPI003449D2DB
MTFDIGSYNSVIDQIEKLLKQVDDGRVSGVPNALNNAENLPYVRLVPPLLRACKLCAEKMIDLAKWVWDKVVDLLKGVIAPVYMYMRSQDWNDVRNTVTTIQSTIDPNNLEGNRQWKGAAQLSYLKTGTTQSQSAGKIGEIADKAKTALEICAAASLVFYIAILNMIRQFLIALAAGIAALATGVGAPAGLSDIAAASGVTAASVWAALALLTPLLAAQGKALLDLEAAASDNSTFPEGANGVSQWPDPKTSTFNDASVDGDNESKWRLN